VEWDSVSASKTKSGYAEFSTPSSPPKRYRRATFTGGNVEALFQMDDQPASHPLFSCSRNIFNTIVAQGPVSGYAEYAIDGTVTSIPVIDGVILNGTCSGDSVTVTFDNLALNTGSDHFCSKSGIYIWNETQSLFEISDCLDSGSATATNATTLSIPTLGANATATLSIEYLTSELVAHAVDSLPAYDNDWNDTPGSFANLTTDELTYSIRQSRYRIRFKIPQVRTGKCYRVNWAERFIPEAGTSISSVEVYSPGVYRPTVTLSAPHSGGTQARAVAVMSSTGTVSSIRILNPGSGYTSAPIVTVQAAINSGTTATGWTATLTGGQVTLISGGSGGDYRPTLTFSAPPSPGTTATATCTVDEQGGIDAVSVTASGSGYTSAPTLTITSKVSGATTADLLLHLGTETTKCTTWDGTTPGGYDPATPSTYPILGDGTNPYFSLAVPTSDGTTLVANVRAVCDCSSCP
jgi:hypothetical protein